MRVQTTAGVVEGAEKDGMLQFRDIPYAASTAGANRFRPPQPVEPWDGVRPAHEYGPIAPQAGISVEALLGAKARPQSEDCLALTVTTPALEGRRPVLFWIHGGAFTGGSGSTPWYDGRRLAARGDVVVVSINYRLGSLGFLHVEPLLGDDYAGAGNAGLLDQIAALRWVQDNIEAFGGDPHQVLVFGESAGGMSTSTLLGTPAASGMFHAAAPQSGACDHVSTADRAAEIADAVLRHLGATDPQALLDAEVTTLLAAQQAASTELLLSGSPGLSLPFQPVVDGTVLPRHPLDAIRDGAASGIPLLTGTTKHEWAMFHLMARAEGPLDHEAVADRAQRILDRRFGAGAGGEVVAAYRAERGDPSPDDLWVAICTDVVFRMPMISLVEAHRPHAPGTWVYRFSHETPAFGGALGACHAIEIPFVFDVLHRRGVDQFVGPIDDRARALAHATSGAWLAFARYHQPGHEGLAPWPEHDLDRRPVMDLGPDQQVLDDPDGATRELWQSLMAAATV
jgi:para-nitrobenzyl esterase